MTSQQEVGTAAPAALTTGARLPLARYRLEVRLREALCLPDYAGSLLRGQFGAALRRTACITKAKTCDGCPLLRTCPYPAIFETPAPATHPLQKFSAVPNPYVIEPPPRGLRRVAAGDLLRFEMVLVGQALERLPLIVYAWQRALANGLGRQRVVGELVDVSVERDGTFYSVWDAGGARLLPHETGLTVPAFPAVQHITLELLTPLRLQDNGRPLRPADLTARKLVTALLRRAGLLFEFHAGTPGLGAQAPALARAAEALADERALRWHDWTRYSSRQKQEMTLGGVVGSWTLRGELAPLLPWLWLGQWLHVGKNATMGLGRYRLH
ncbi:MAG: CRISPR system precrRNA processing endoribonuclease RAMP protein Cas6, partial [Burkholderiaceae bacterium]|nr:CRISPR system precrRNA processing endoribonuclease RAMP protein Cas6 [Burkholderiaceae bacterium]